MSGLKINYFEDTDSLIVNFEVAPEKQVGRVEVREIKKDEVLMSADEAGNVFGIEVMGRASETFDLEKLVVRGMKVEMLPKVLGRVSLKEAKEMGLA